ncbi:MurR/RpiR family transcriptional regulator [Companilactobacillus insicii]|uniref:MurR/RpiR family transcriptional regulator n=1 Tax=Companilactobacillus insicii TaxID=1732567 RepID=UPI000F76CD34|nr:MurR/RpiR family transcriptional regulator [Companilactobacillus insicii]
MDNTILLSIHAQQNINSKAENILGDYILNNAQIVPQLSVSELANKSGVSQATVVRFAKNLGLNGFKELKVELARGTSSSITSLSSEISATDTLDELKQKMSLRVQHSIDVTNKGLKTELVDKTVDELQNHDVIQAYGLGASGLVARDFTQKFSRIGKTVINTDDTHQFAVNLLTQTSSQILILFSDSGESKETVKIGNLAVKNNVPIVGVTSNKESSLAKISDILLPTSDSMPRDQIRSAATTSLMSQLYAVDLIYYCYLQRDYDTNVRKLKESHELVDEIFHKGSKK